MIRIAYAALWIFVFSVPWERIIVLPGISIVTRVTGGVALIIALFAVVVSGRIRRWHLFHTSAFLFLVWAAAVLFFTSGGNSIPNKFWTYVQLFLVLWMIWELALSGRRLLGLLTAYVLGAYVAALDTILLYRREAGALRRFAAGGADPNDLAMVLALALPMAWYLGMTYRRPLVRWACRAYLPLAVVAIGLTGSRGGMLATFVALLIVPLTMGRLSPGRFAAAILVLGLSGALAVAYVPETLVQRFASTGTEVEDLRFGGRFKLWVAGVEAFSQRPVAGYGTGGFKAAITPKLGGMSQVAHNSFLSVLVEQGLVGFLLYMSMLIAVFRAALRLAPLERRFALVLLATLGVAMLPLTWEDRKAVWIILAILLGLSQSWIAPTGGAVPLPRWAVPARPPAATRRLQPMTARHRNTTA